MFTVPVHSTSQSDYSFLNYANKKNQNESMLIKRNQNEWKSFNLPTQTWKNHIVFAYFWMSIFASILVTIPNNGDKTNFLHRKFSIIIFNEKNSQAESFIPAGSTIWKGDINDSYD